MRAQKTCLRLAPALLIIFAVLALATLETGRTTVIAAPNNQPQLVRDVDRPAAQPFLQRSAPTFVQGFAFAMGDSFTVPDGKRLVIEFVSLQLQVPPGQNVLFARLDTDTNPTAPIDLVLTLSHPGTDVQGNEIFVATHRVFAIFEPGTVVRPTAFRNSGTGTGTMFVSIGGYLVDVI